MKKSDGLIHVICLLAILCAAAREPLRAEPLDSSLSPADSSSKESASLSNSSGIWQNGVGEGFRPGAHFIGLDAGAGFGVEAFGGRQAHDLALMSISYGRMVGRIRGEGHWYRGNWELRGEIFGGAQFAPTSDWLIGFTPHLRYNFATGSRWIPFVDLGAGVSATGIGHPDLSNRFEFNLQACTGVQWFLKDNVAMTFEARWLHLSCAGISTPNLGLNTMTGMVGLRWFF